MLQSKVELYMRNKSLTQSNFGYFGAFVSLISATGISLWICCRLIVILAYGWSAFFHQGLHIVKLKNGEVYLSNGDELTLSWSFVFMCGYGGFLYLLWIGAEKLAGLLPQILAIGLIGLLGFAGWLFLIAGFVS
jgi:hypothetical protein